MPKLSRVSGEEAIRALERLGFAQIRQLNPLAEVTQCIQPSTCAST
jgi:hypothetical protein